MCKSLTEMNHQMFYVCAAIKCKCMGLFLLGDPLSIYTLTHNVVKVLDGNGTEVQYLDNLDFQLDRIGCGPGLNHGIHDFARVFV